jgi:hypothetical protein
MASELLWGKFGIGPVSYPNRWVQIKSLFARLRRQLTGEALAISSPVTLDQAICFSVMAHFPQPNTFTVYYSPGLDGSSTWVAPITETNLGKIRAIPAALPALLASNGYTIVHLRKNVIKVFPTIMAKVYSNAPIDEARYP